MFGTLANYWRLLRIQTDPKLNYRIASIFAGFLLLSSQNLFATVVFVLVTPDAIVIAADGKTTF